MNKHPSCYSKTARYFKITERETTTYREWRERGET